MTSNFESKLRAWAATQWERIPPVPHAHAGSYDRGYQNGLADVLNGVQKVLESSGDETSPDEELRKRATRLIVAMRRDRWEGHDHGYTNDLAALLNVGSPVEPTGDFATNAMRETTRLEQVNAVNGVGEA